MWMQSWFLKFNKFAYLIHDASNDYPLIEHVDLIASQMVSLTKMTSR